MAAPSRYITRHCRSLHFCGSMLSPVICLAQWMKPTMRLPGMVLRSFRWSPRCNTCHMQLADTRTLPQLHRCADSCLRCIVLDLHSVTWSTADLPRLVRSVTWSMRLSINLSRISNGTQSSEMDVRLVYCAVFFGFGRATTVASLREFGCTET